MAVNLHQSHFRFGINELAESTHGWLANIDTNISLAVDTTFLLRFTEQETGGTAAANITAQFQYNLNGAGWVNITTSSAVVKALAGVLTNGGNCTKRLTGTGTFETTGAGQTTDGSSGGNANDIAASGNSETECVLQVIGADVNNNDTIQFRFTSGVAVTYDVTPTLTVIKSSPVIVSPGTGSMVLTGFAPTIVINTVISAGLGLLTLTGFAPTVEVAAPNIVVNPGTGQIVLEGFAPTIQLSDNKIIVPGVGELTLNGFVPVVNVSDNKVVNPALGELVLEGFTPSIVIGAVVYPGTGQLINSGFAPIITATDNKVINPGLGQLVLAGYAPAINVGVNVNPGQGELILAGFNPDVVITNNVLINAGKGQLTLTGYAPTVIAGGAGPTYISYGIPYLCANTKAMYHFLEVYMRATAGTVRARLIDLDNNQIVSELETSSSEFELLRSSAIEIIKGHQYGVQFGKDDGSCAGEFIGAKIVTKIK